MSEALFQVLFDNLSSLIQKEVGLIIGVDKEMNKLSSILSTIQAVLQDAEDKQYESKPIRNWLRKLNDLAYEIEDILDECAIEISKFEKKPSTLSLKKILFQRKIGRRMREITEKLDAVAAERGKFHLREIVIQNQTEVIAGLAKRETGSFLSELNDVFGRDEEKEKIVDILVNHVKDCQQLSILPIIGIGGLGKTTLAQLVYNDPRIEENFDLKLWACVSDDFSSKTIIKAMLESGKWGGSASDSMSLDALQRRVWELLNKRKYLLILDDVWNENQEKWIMLKNVLACGSRGASIVVTTRLEKVANIMRTLPSHYLTGLSEEHCWSLFKERAFGQEVDEHPNLEIIGRQIVKKCAGVPLAATTLGGLLRFKRKEKEWIYVKESELWNLDQEETSILPALRLSYRHLPLELRKCFAYCALFPKDSEIEKEELIFLWMAHGCISSNGKKEVEDVGDEVWNELLLRSLIQDLIKYGRSFCKMHDLVHDLALSIMENQVPGAHAMDGPSASNSKIRQLHVSENFMTLPTSIQLQVSTLNSLVNYSHVRMLKANSRLSALPSSIGKLKQLRCLNLSNSSIRTLPNTIYVLRNLQILNLNCCSDLVSLPKNIRNMDSLRHIFLENCGSLIETPSKIGELNSLKTLSVFIVGDKKGNQLGELECLNLGGRLEIRHLERVKTHRGAIKANLSEKPNLRDLILRWEGNNASESREMMDKMVLEALETHPNIETLQILGFKGKVFPVWMRSPRMTNVIKIKISDCRNCSHLPPLGDLPCLKMLILLRLDMIEFITDNGFQGGIRFPSLEELHLKFLPNLKGLLKEEVGEMFPNLHELYIHECSSLRLPPLPSLKKLEVHECSNSTLSSFSKFDSLTNLRLELNENTATRIPDDSLERLSNLETLNIWNANEHTLPVERLRCLKSLTHLAIRMRKTETCLPGEWLQHLTTLETLSIYDYSNTSDLVKVPDEIKHLSHLKRFCLQGYPKMVSLPEGLQHVQSLETLWLENLDQLTSLPDWLGKLMSLEYLSIGNCPRIASLPSSLREMTNLQTLQIWYCPELIRRCEKGKGEDWPNIAHIPSLRIYLLEVDL